MGPGSSIALMSAATIAALGLAPQSGEWIAATITLSIMVGALCLAAGFARLGFLNEFISKPVISGFVAGLALLIAVGQIPKMLGIQGVPGNFWDQAYGLIASADSISYLALVIGAGSILLLQAGRILIPKVPMALIVVLASIFLVSIAGLDDQGIAIVGQIPEGLPLLGIPTIDLGLIGALIPGALGVVIVAYTETLSSGRAFASKRHYRINANQEFIALGWSNLGSGLAQGFAVDGSLSRSAAKFRAGANTQLSTLITSLAILITLLFLTPIFTNLAQATLGALVVYGVLPLLKPAMWIHLWKAARLEFWAALVTALSVVTLGALPGLGVGIAFSLILLIVNMSIPYMPELVYDPAHDIYTDKSESAEGHRTQGLVVVRPEARLFFANATALRDKVVELLAATSGERKTVLISLEGVNDVDITAADMLIELKSELAEIGVDLELARVKISVLRRLKSLGALDAIGREHVHASVREAVNAFEKKRVT